MKVRHFVILALLPLASVPALAGTREDVMSAASRCAGIADDRAWLDCYYGSAQPMRAQLGLVPAPASQIAKVPPASMAVGIAAAPPPSRSQASAPPRQGFLGSFFGGGSEPRITLASYRFDRRGRFTATLSDGEVWEQLPDDVNIAHWREAGSKYRVSVIEHFGRSELVVDNDGQTYQVRRVN